MSAERSRYTYFIYDDDHACVDCEECNRKVANLHGSTSAEVMARVVEHEKRRHGKDPA